MASSARPMRMAPGLRRAAGLGVAGLCLVATLAGCRHRTRPAEPADDSGVVTQSCPHAGRRELSPGLIAEQVPVKVATRFGDGDACIDLVRLDPARYRPRVLTALADGGARTAPEWAHDFGLAAVINASMYLPNLRSIGLLVDPRGEHTARDNPKLGAFLGFDPTRADLPPVTLAGRACPGFDLAALRRDYQTVVQNYRMLDCDGSPLGWKDPHRTSVAAVGLDQRGWVVLIHVRTPITMTEVNAALAAPSIDLTAAMYVEGGSEASLYVAAGDTKITAIGAGFLAPAVEASFRKIPNVIGFVRI